MPNGSAQMLVSGATARLNIALLILVAFSMRPAIASSETAQNIHQRTKTSTAYNNYLPLAERGDRVAQHALGDLYAQGKGVSQNYVEALKWYRKAAEQGYAEAVFKLGWSYAKGLGIPRNKEQAFNWYRKAADQGHAKGQYMVGMMYTLGLVVHRDYAQGLEWHRKAADQGHGKAQLMLGRMYSYGAGAPINLVQAYFWLNLASVAGVKGAAEAHELVSLAMSADQFEQAESLSQAWWAKHPSVL